MRSATSGQLYFQRTRTMTFKPRSFKVSGLRIWDDLAIMNDPSLSKYSIGKFLKSFLLDNFIAHLRNLYITQRNVLHNNNNHKFIALIINNKISRNLYFTRYV